MLLTGTRKRDHISPILASLHWLPMRFRVDFKVLLLVFKALNGQAPSYITDLLTPYSTARPLRSSKLPPQSKLKSRGDCAFAVAAPRLWNSIPLFYKISPVGTPGICPLSLTLISNVRMVEPVT